MKRCPTCGMLYSDMVTECPNCKVRLGDNSQPSPRPATPPVQPLNPAGNPVQTSYVPPQTVTPVPVANKDKGGFLWYIPGLLMPIAGLIVGLCVKKNKPNCASAAFRGAGIGFVANLILANVSRFL